ERRRDAWPVETRDATEAAASPAYRVALAAEICGDRELALSWLGSALGAGYPRAGVDQEPELQRLRLSPGYSRLVAP
ncbi:MAG: hypothetical protein AAFY88_14660, partial [Acidobacteriota bacterium]